MNVSGKGILVAAAVGALFGCATTSGSGSTNKTTSREMVQCAGLNACKGQGSCQGNENACKAKNECKGKGWVESPSAEDCTSKGGSVLPKSG
jgi:hypothetical protein